MHSISSQFELLLSYHQLLVIVLAPHSAIVDTAAGLASFWPLLYIQQRAAAARVFILLDRRHRTTRTCSSTSSSINNEYKQRRPTRATNSSLADRSVSQLAHCHHCPSSALRLLRHATAIAAFTPRNQPPSAIDLSAVLKSLSVSEFQYVQLLRPLILVSLRFPLTTCLLLLPTSPRR